MAASSIQKVAILLCLVASCSAFTPSKITLTHPRTSQAQFNSPSLLFNSDENKGVIDLTDDEEDSPPPMEPKQMNTAPFLSQGELSTDPNLLSPDFKDPKQTRVIIYIILTLVPILFLIPLMIGSRDLIPLDALPPVELN
jgi:hypothetical protein